MVGVAYFSHTNLFLIIGELMFFVRQAILSPPAVMVSAETDPIWGNGGALTGTKDLPAAYTADSTFEYNINGCDQIYVGVAVIVLGGGGLTGVTLLISFQDPSDTTVWYPSKEPACSVAAGIEIPLRIDTLANNEWPCIGVGNYLVSSRKEHKQFRKFRVQFRRTAGATDATTRIRAFWYHSGGEALVPEQ